MIKKYEIKAIEVNSEFEFSDVKIRSSEDSEKIVRQIMAGDLVILESFVVLFLNQGHFVTAWAKISTGGITATVVDPIIVAKYAIDTLSKAVILAHNHPSGALKPSNADLTLTNTIKEGLNLFSISTLDHLIIGESGYFSFADEGLI